MPEGDSYVRAADRIRPVLCGKRLVAVEGAPEVRRWAGRLVDREVTEIRTQGKHLLVDVAGDVTIHVWLGMPGRVRVGRRQAGWERARRVLSEDRGAVRLLLATDTHLVVVAAAPTVEVERRRVIDARLARLGPDVLSDAWDVDRYLELAARVPPERPAHGVLLDQRVLAGVGNEYAAEVLFTEGVHPARPWGDLGPAGWRRLAERARRLMAANARRPGPRVTTGWSGRGRESWVFERTGRPCRRCRTPVVQGWISDRHRRIAYWCPRCQPAPEPALSGDDPAPGAGPR